MFEEFSGHTAYDEWNWDMLIFAGGELPDLDGEALKREVGEKTLVMCADSGLDGCVKYGISPDYVVGDMDSVDPEVLNSIEGTEGTNVERFAVEKDFTDAHVQAVLAHPLVDAEGIRARGFKVVLDAVNSVGGIVMPRLLEALGVECVKLNCEPTGQFAHNPEPLPSHLVDLCSRVASEKADLGIAVDPDVDRLALVCEDGSFFGEEYTLVSVADYVLSLKPGPTVSNLSSSRALRDVTEARGCTYTAAAVGEVNVTTEMKRTGAVIGGEGNGGVIVPDLHYGRDALIGTALFLSSLVRSGKKVTEVRAGLPQYVISKNRIELSDRSLIEKILEEIKKRYASERITDIDGVKIDFDREKMWVHLRKSNTEPIIRVYSEAADEASAAKIAAEVIGIAEKIIG